MVYSRTFYHVIFSTCRRQRLITRTLEPLVHQTLRDVFKRLGAYSCFLNGVEDHIHILVHIDPRMSVLSVIEEGKHESQDIIAAQSTGFMWQRGCAIFSVSHHDYKGLLHYIRDQKIRHARQHTRPEFEWPSQTRAP